MSDFAARFEGRLGNGVGVAVTIGVHVLALIFLLSNNVHVEPEPRPLMAHVIGETTTEQAHPEKMKALPPSFDQPQLHVPVPEIELADTASSATVISVSPSTTSSSSAGARSTPDSMPRFDADYLNNPPPEYPRVSRRLREQGVVTLRVYVSSSGQPEVVELKQSSGSVRLDESALEAVRKWKFVPAQSAGRMIGAWVFVPVEFSLNT